MQRGKEVYRSVKLTDSVKPIELSISDQIKLLFMNIKNDDLAELDVNEKLSVDRLRKIAALSGFIDKATKRLDRVGEKELTALVSSKFLPYIEDVKKDKGRFYDIEVIDRKLPISVKHKVVMRIRKKGVGK